VLCISCFDLGSIVLRQVNPRKTQQTEYSHILGRDALKSRRCRVQFLFGQASGDLEESVAIDVAAALTAPCGEMIPMVSIFLFFYSLVRRETIGYLVAASGGSGICFDYICYCEI